MQSIGNRQELRYLFFTWWIRWQIRGWCGCRTAAAGPAQQTSRFDAQKGPVRGRRRWDDFRLCGTRTPPLTAVGRRTSRQRLQWYPIDSYRLPVALTVCERKIPQGLERIGLNTFVKHSEITIASMKVSDLKESKGIQDHVLWTLDREEDEDCGGGLQGMSSFSRGFESNRIRSHFPGRNSGAVVAKKMSRFEVIKLRLGMAIVWTRLPFIINRISIVSLVKAITYGKAQAIINKCNKSLSRKTSIYAV